MSASFPGFVYAIPSCPEDFSSETGCCFRSNLEAIAIRTHRNRLNGTTGLVNSLLQAWDMKNVTQAATAAIMGKKIEIYVAPCAQLIEIALGFSCEVATMTASMFQHVIDQGAEPPTIPCAIRVDDRLGSTYMQNCPARMKLLKSILNECAQGGQFGFNLWPAPQGVTSGTWFAYHFDISYVDRRCYLQEQNPIAGDPFSIAEILNERGGAASTGKLFILEDAAVIASVEGVSFPDSHPSAEPMREWQMFQLVSEPENPKAYVATYFREHQLSLQQAQSGPQSGAQYSSQAGWTDKEKREKHWEDENAKVITSLKGSAKEGSAKGLFKAGWKLGKNKMGKFVEDTQRNW